MASKVKSSTRMLNSPRLVRTTSPEAPTQSPRVEIEEPGQPIAEHGRVGEQLQAARGVLDDREGQARPGGAG